MEMDANKKQAYGWCGRRSAGSTDVLEAEWDEMPLCLLILIGKDGIWEENMEKRLYTNGTIVTMERAYPTAEAVLTEGKYILAVGRRDALEKEADHIVNLNGKTMLPSFLDSHGHLMGVASGMLQADVSNAHSFAEIAEQIQRFLRQNAPREGQWVVATGADHGIMQEGRLPSKRFLDRITAAYPLVLQHISGHSGVFNSKGLAVLGITVESQSPAGGTIDYENGLLEENAFLQALEHIPLPDQNALLAAFGQAQRYYASYGITTAQEGMFVKQIHDIYQELYQREQLWMDVVAYVDLKNDPEGVDAFPHCRGKYHHHFRIGGYKVLLDDASIYRWYERIADLDRGCIGSKNDICDPKGAAVVGTCQWGCSDRSIFTGLFARESAMGTGTATSIDSRANFTGGSNGEIGTAGSNPIVFSGACVSLGRGAYCKSGDGQSKEHQCGRMGTAVWDTLYPAYGCAGGNAEYIGNDGVCGREKNKRRQEIGGRTANFSL